MKNLNHLPIILLKSSILMFLIFWTMLAEHIYINPFIVLSLLPIFILCVIVICLTIVPFLVFNKKRLSRNEIFKKYFSYYAIVAFGIASYGIIISDFSYFMSAFLTSLFFTLMYAWVWLFNSSASKNSKFMNYD